MRLAASWLTLPVRFLPVRRLFLPIAWTVCIVPPVAAQHHHSALEEGEGKWMMIDLVEHGSVYLDTAQVVPVGGEVYRIRTRWRFARARTDHEGERYRSSVAVRAIDCGTREMAILAFADRDGRRVVETAEQPLYAASWEPVNPDSVAERILAWTCALGQQRGRIATTASPGS